jgi:hypothetical protein
VVDEAKELPPLRQVMGEEAMQGDRFGVGVYVGIGFQDLAKDPFGVRSGLRQA